MILQQRTPNPFTNGKFIGQGVSAEVYHRQDPKTPRGHPQFVMSRSELMLFASCPYRWISGYQPKDTDATEWGSLFDCLITATLAEFDSRYVVRPATVAATANMKCVRRGEAKVGDQVSWRACEEAEQWKEANEKGRQILSPDDLDEVVQAREQLNKDPILGEFVACSAKQVMVTCEYSDPDTGLVVPWKSLIDFVPAEDHEPYGAYLGDLKTCRTADPNAWDREVDMRNYDAQAAANLDAYQAAMPGTRPRECFVHVMVENAFPFVPSGAFLSDEYVEFGRLKIKSALEFYCRCLSLKKWPTWRDFTRRDVYGGFIRIDADQRHSLMRQRPT